MDNPVYGSDHESPKELLNSPSINELENSPINDISFDRAYELVKANQEAEYDVINRRGASRPHPPMTLPVPHDPTSDQAYSILSHTEQQEHGYHVLESTVPRLKEASPEDHHYHVLESEGQGRSQDVGGGATEAPDYEVPANK